MKHKTKLLTAAFLFLVYGISGFANKTSVQVSAPEKAEKGTEVTITIQVKHIGNTGGHHTDWVYLALNGKEVKRWEYSQTGLPEAGNFTLEYKFVLNEKVKVKVEGHCSRHGSAGPRELEITIEEIPLLKMVMGKTV